MQSGNREKVYLIDGNSLLYRAFFALPHFSTLENQPTNAVYGFTMMLLRVIEEEKPEIIIVAWDAPVKTFRHDEFSDYKAHRKPTPDDLSSQAPLARQMVEAFNIPMLEIPGYEADDVIGTLAKKAQAEGYEAVVVTGDLDALQLVDENISVMRTVKGVTETMTYDVKAVEEQYGLHPRQFPDYKGLLGDTSDNIPGVPGVGAKTAVKLLSEFGSMENLLEHVDDVQPARLQEILRDFREQAVLSKRLATIILDIPLDIELRNCKFTGPDYPVLRELFRALGFSTLLRRLPEEPAQRGLFDVEVEKCELPELPIKIVEDIPGMDELRNEVLSTGEVAIQIHGSSPRGVEADPLGMAISITEGRAYYIPFDGVLSLEDFRTILDSESIAKNFHNLKYEYEVCERSGIEIKGLSFDVLLAAYLINPTRGTHTLESIALDYLGTELPGTSTKAAKLTECSSEERLSARVDAIRAVTPMLKEKLQEDELERLMNEIEMPLSRILGDMELAGVAIDGEWLERLSTQLQERVSELEQDIYRLAGTDFNIGSTKQLQVILFEKLGLPASRKTKTGYSTDAETLAALAPAHEIVAKILEYRELSKLKSTYADSLPKLINPRTGRIHTSLNQAVTATGRLSSSDPNLQNIPIKTEIGRQIRKAFVASPGNVLIAADYSQIELRILAHFSRDPELIRSFQEDEDIHQRTAVKLFGVPPEEVTADMRRQAKTVNFAVIYGMSDYGLSRELNIPTSTAKTYIESYFREYPGVRTYARNTLTNARLNGYVETLLGRRRYMPELTSPNRQFREFAERAAVNMPIQGTAADIVKIAMIQVYERLRDYQTRLVLQVHDELVFDSPEGEVDSVCPMIRRIMEDALKLDVPLKVEVKVGRDWCTALPISAINHQETQA